jgi:hypothetical protein
MAAEQPTNISIAVPRPLKDYEYSDAVQAIGNILAGRSFFWAGDDPLGDEIRDFLIDHPIMSNVELVEDEAD